MSSNGFYCFSRSQSEDKRKQKENQRHEKNLWDMKVTVISIVVDAWTVSKGKKDWESLKSEEGLML